MRNFLMITACLSVACTASASTTVPNIQSGTYDCNDKSVLTLDVPEKFKGYSISMEHKTLDFLGEEICILSEVGVLNYTPSEALFKGDIQAKYYATFRSDPYSSVTTSAPASIESIDTDVVALKTPFFNVEYNLLGGKVVLISIEADQVSKPFMTICSRRL